MSDLNTNGVTKSGSSSGVTAENEVTTEEFNVGGEAVVSKVKEVLREGNIRRITIRNDADKVLLEIPLTIGVVGALIAPQLAALGAVGALIANLNIRVERELTREHGDLAGQEKSTSEVVV